jgi:ubiquitin-conjugating enzyme E2 S
MVSNVENLNPQVLRHIGRELQSLKSEPMEGITVVLDEKDMTSIEAVIDGPADTPYYGGKFRVRLTIGQDFPQGPPKGFFLTKIFHPNVGARGEICVNTLKRDWKSDLVKIFLNILALILGP